MIKKPKIYAICGKSAAGKDTFAMLLEDHYWNLTMPAKIIISDTTRPPRINEKDGIDYNFISRDQFLKNAEKNKYLEWSYFRGWHYGTNKNSIKEGMINIGVFNVDGLKKLHKYLDRYNIIPIYLKVNWFTRLKRSIKREHKFKLEYLRRMITDWKDFIGIKKILKTYPKYLYLVN